MLTSSKSVCGRRVDARKSIDHASKRKSTINMLSNYTCEELKEALLKCEDVITELQMKYKCVKASYGKLTQATIVNDEKKKEMEEKVQHLSNQVAELEKRRDESLEQSRKDKEFINRLKEELGCSSNRVVELEKLNNENVSKSEQVREKQHVLQLEEISPHVRKDSTKYFFMHDSVVKWIENDNVDINLMSIYKNLILDLQDVMDFYSLLSGVSIWKSKSYNLDTSDMLVKNGHTQYFCQLNPGLLNIAPNGYRFIINVNYEGGIIKYSPDASSETFKTFVPQCLQEPSSFNVDQSYMFLKNIFQDVVR